MAIKGLALVSLDSDKAQIATTVELQQSDCKKIAEIFHFFFAKKKSFECKKKTIELLNIEQWTALHPMVNSVSSKAHTPMIRPHHALL